ncbi:DUF4422 domain-containing protein [Pelistega sp. MC2]|uniref:DUF4422 domain-containing protein n=1 Tax=Pelistega sp. MC2 TaxID=1720297 RepID=UPI0008D95DE8|nr:DUF4422 domain-containing protein [Pelistega sp. MC2]
MIEQKIAIMVATHKPYTFPADKGYLPVHVGKALNNKDIGAIGDNTGENISSLNPYFCELTGLYWLWKNVKAEFYGLAHYRRYFRPLSSTAESETINKQAIASADSLVTVLDKYDIMLSKKRNYWIETVQQHYEHAHYKDDLEKLYQIIQKKYPDYVTSLEQVLKGTSLSLYNMCVIRADKFNDYCTWLFDILIDLEPQIPYQTYGNYQKRVFGFLAERLLNVWVKHNIPNEKVLYASVVNIEGEDLIDKAKGLLKRKFLGKKLD